MKRSEMLDVIEQVIDDLLVEGAFGKITCPYDPTKSNSIIADIRFGNVEGRILDVIEEAGMLPPTIPSKKLKREDYPYEAGCTMRCNCEDCNPEYGVNKWEPEDEDYDR